MRRSGDAGDELLSSLLIKWPIHTIFTTILLPLRPIESFSADSSGVDVLYYFTNYHVSE